MYVGTIVDDTIDHRLVLLIPSLGSLLVGQELLWID